MKVLILSKPVYDYILPLQLFPEDGDVFLIEKSINTISSIGSIVACLFGKYGSDISFAGVVGEDNNGKNIQKILENYKVDTKFLEINYEQQTCQSFKIYNQKSNKFTTINEYSLTKNLTKYKYDFIPDVIIMDDKDFSANLSALNNYPNAKSIFISNKFTKDSVTYCKKCNYCICSLSFVSEATGIYNNLNKQKTIVEMFQKYVDLYSSNLIIKMDNYDILYCINDEVRMMKNTNNNLNNKDTIYYAVLSYLLSNNMDIEYAIKYTNKIMLSSNNDINILNNIPEASVVKVSFEEYELIKKQTINQVNNANLNNQVANSNQVITTINTNTSNTQVIQQNVPQKTTPVQNQVPVQNSVKSNNMSVNNIQNTTQPNNMGVNNVQKS